MDPKGFCASCHTCPDALYEQELLLAVAELAVPVAVRLRENYGAGYDAVLVPESVEAVDTIYFEIRAKGAQIVQPPAMTAYGSREFVFSDVDGRLIGVGRIGGDEGMFFGSTT
jgi:hypothetical protein